MLWNINWKSFNAYQLKSLTRLLICNKSWYTYAHNFVVVHAHTQLKSNHIINHLHKKYNNYINQMQYREFTILLSSIDLIDIMFAHKKYNYEKCDEIESIWREKGESIVDSIEGFWKYIIDFMMIIDHHKKTLFNWICIFYLFLFQKKRSNY